MKQILYRLRNYDPQEMQKLLNDGLSKKAIATKLNVNIASVRSFILKHNITFLPPIAQRKSKIYNYDPKEIEDLLNKFSKHRLCKDLGISIKSLENYIKLHQIQYTKPKIKRRLVERYSKPKPKNTKEITHKPKRITVNNSIHTEVENPLELFKEKFEKRKKERMIRELKDGYY